MKIRIQSIHFNADQKLLNFVNDKVDKLMHFYDHIIEGEVFLKLDKASDLQNMSVDGKRRVVDNSGQAGAATQQQGLMKADGMPARPFCALR